MPRTITDTADRIRNTDQITVNGKPALVLNIAAAATLARPARIAVTVCDPSGSLADLNDTRTVHLDAGEIVTFTPGTTMRHADAAGRRPNCGVAR